MGKNDRHGDDDDRMSSADTFVQVGETMFRSCDMLEQVAPKAEMLTPEDLLILLSMSLALEAHLKGLRYRYGVLGNVK